MMAALNVISANYVHNKNGQKLKSVKSNGMEQNQRENSSETEIE